MNKYLHVGPGGVKCACCFPAPGSKERRKRVRAAKKREARAHWAREQIAKTPLNDF
jgi:disulfide oxidoreductase YuzD